MKTLLTPYDTIYKTLSKPTENHIRLPKGPDGGQDGGGLLLPPRPEVGAYVVSFVVLVYFVCVFAFVWGVRFFIGVLDQMLCSWLRFGFSRLRAASTAKATPKRNQSRPYISKYAKPAGIINSGNTRWILPSAWDHYHAAQ